MTKCFDSHEGKGDVQMHGKADSLEETEKGQVIEQEKKEKIEYHLGELKKLRATPRSDWHAGFEALLRIEMHKFADMVHISTEEEIGEVPPRTDFVILVEDEKVEFEKAIFRIFRKINILEYKSHHDSLNERILRKVCGYANLYIGVAEHEGERPSDEVTISIFRAVKNPEMFREMEENGSLVRDDVAGIYHVKGYTDLPFQIIITGELEGEEYAAYRALTDRAEKADVERIVWNVKQEQDAVMLDHYGVLLNLVVEKNPQFFELVKGENTMKEMLLEMVKDEVDAQVKERVEEQVKERVEEQVKERVEEQVQQTKVFDIKKMMNNLKLTLDQAMDALEISPKDRATYTVLVKKKS